MKTGKLRVGVVVNRQKSGARALLVQLRHFERATRSIRFLWEKNAAALIQEKGHSIRALLKKADLLLVAGGDGSLLRVVGQIYPGKIPILGINLGSLGFLTSIAQDELFAALPKIAQRRWKLSPRVALETTVWRKGKKMTVPCSLNDVVVSSLGRPVLVRIRVSVGEAFVTEYVSDGLIVSTPTGSTAYSVSAGGPMVAPEARAFCITPICPHTLTNRSLVVDAGQVIRIDIPAQPNRLGVLFDGKLGSSLRAGDRIEIRAAPKPVYLAYTHNRNFYAVLRDKLKWSGASV